MYNLYNKKIYSVLTRPSYLSKLNFSSRTTLNPQQIEQMEFGHYTVYDKA